MTPAPTRTLIAAHRGGAGLWPENSMTAFRSVLALPVDQVETDIHLSADGEPYILHDPTLDRTTEATGIASALTWAQLSRIRLKNTATDTIPHLDELLALLAATSLTLRLELKKKAGGKFEDGIYDPALLPRAIASLEASSMLTRTVFTSFNRSYLKQVRAAGLTNPTIWLMDRPELSRDWVDGMLILAKGASIPEIAPHIADANETVAAAIRLQGVRFGCYAVNDQSAIDKALALGAAVFTTDRPDLAIATVARAG